MFFFEKILFPFGKQRVMCENPCRTKVRQRGIDREGKIWYLRSLLHFSLEQLLLQVKVRRAFRECLHALGARLLTEMVVRVKRSREEQTEAHMSANSHHHAPLTRPSASQRASRDTETTLALYSLRLQSTGDVHTWVPSPGVAPVRVETPLNCQQTG